MSIQLVVLLLGIKNLQKENDNNKCLYLNLFSQVGTEQASHCVTLPSVSPFDIMLPASSQWVTQA